MQLKPALRYAPQLHEIVGLEDPPFLAIDQVKDLCNMSNEELSQHLKSVNFISEAQEFRIASLDGLVSFPVGCFYRSCKGGANKVKIYDRKTEELLQACKNCILNSSNCNVLGSTCDEEGIICDDSESLEENPNFVNWMALHACVCTRFLGSLTLKLLRELT